MSMELRRAADALLRSQTSPLAAFLFPATNVRWMTNAQLGYRGCSNRQIQRSFTSGVQRNAIRPSATTTAAPPPSTEASISESDPTEPQPALEEQAKSLGWTARPRGYAVPTLSREREKALNGGSSADDLMAMLKQRRSPSTMDVTRMRDTKLLQQSGGFGLSQSFNNEMGVYKPPRKPILLNPSTGRSVTVGTGIDVAKGFRLMEMSCARNKVRTDAMRQRFHERGGLKRKRLRRERWRVRFLEGFKATVSRVKQLKHQGW